MVNLIPSHLANSVAATGGEEERGFRFMEGARCARAVAGMPVLRRR